MSEELYFNNELCRCLNAAGLSDCGENDSWNYWYQRVYKAHNQTIDRVTEVQRAENAKLRKMNEAMWLIIRCAIGEVSARDGLPVIHEDDLIMLRNMRRDLRNEVDE